MSTAPSYNGLCGPIPALEISQYQPSELLSVNRAVSIYIGRNQNPPNQFTSEYRRNFRSNAERIAYQKAVKLAAAPAGPLPSQRPPASILAMRQFQQQNNLCDGP